ncbi:hypothetical protein ABZ635_16940 [Nocardiopsis sp. NPDC007018]|uniref:hypothetical protein n=1 Tax=Nocardiopsis sp. NPDC007018 TaxID=3155721 RepID=UPI0033F8E0CA
MTDSEVAANPEAVEAAARIAERVSGALDGVTHAFETRAELLDEASVEARINGAFSDYFVEHKEAVRTVEENGTTIARNARAAGERISTTDFEAGLGFRHPTLDPHGYGTHDHDTSHILREINREVPPPDHRLQ